MSFVGQDVYFKNSAHNQYLGTDGKKVYVTPNKNAWECFSVQDAGNGKVYLYSATHKQVIGISPDAKPHVTPNKAAWEQFTFVPGKTAGTFALKSDHKTHFCTDGKQVLVTPNLDAWESWVVEVAGPHHGVKYFIKNVGLGKYLCMDNSADNKLLLSGNPSLWEQFTLSEHKGKTVITSAAHAGKHICGQPDKYSTTPNKDLWETHTITPNGKGAFHITNHHGKHMGGKGDNTIAPSANTGSWEEWTFIRA